MVQINFQKNFDMTRNIYSSSCLYSKKAFCSCLPMTG